MFVPIVNYIAILLLFTYIVSYGDMMMILNIHREKIAIFHERRLFHFYPGTVSGIGMISWTIINGIGMMSVHYVIVGLLGFILFNEFMGFPAIFRPINFPEFESFGQLPKEVRAYLSKDDLIAVENSGTIRIYPIAPLKMNHIVNDDFNEKKLLISHCALCKTSVVYSRMVNGSELTFEATTSTNESNLIIRDSEGNFWQQMSGEGLGPKNKGQKLELITSLIIGEGRIPRLIKDGYQVEIMNYSHQGRKKMAATPFANLMQLVDNPEKKVLFPVSHWDDRLPRKTNVMGFTFNDKHYAIPSHNGKLVNHRIVVDGQSLQLLMDRTQGKYTVTDVSSKNQVHSVFPVYWFAWAARYRDTTIIELEDVETQKLDIFKGSKMLDKPVVNL